MKIHVFTGNSTRAILSELIPQFELASGHEVSVSYDPAKVMLKRIAAGESADLAILGESAIDELIQQGKITAASRRVIARLGAGIGVRSGASRPDISTVEAFKRTLLDAKSIAYASEGASGIHFSGVIEKLGISSQVHAKARTRPGGLIGELVVAGEAEIVVQQIPELMAVPGIDVVGPFPPELQMISVTTTGIFASSRQSEAAQGLLDFLTTPAAARVFKARGLEPAF
jgi:molybdate transport system substrate-binding protein